MEVVRGRIFTDPTLAQVAKEERRPIYEDMCRVLSKIHNVNIDKAGLGKHGKPGKMLKDLGVWLLISDAVL